MLLELSIHRMFLWNVDLKTIQEFLSSIAEQTKLSSANKLKLQDTIVSMVSAQQTK